MWALDQVKSYFTGDVKIDDPEIRQALKDAFPNLAKAGSEFDDLEYLPATYINEKLIPELVKLDDVSKIEQLKVALGTNAKLRALISEFTFTALKPGTMPARTDTVDDIKSSLDSWFQDLKQFFEKLTWIENVHDREEYLFKQAIFRANRARAEMDKMLLEGNRGIFATGWESIWNGKLYGSNGGAIQAKIAWNDIADMKDLDNVRSEAGDYSKDDVEPILSALIKQAWEPWTSIALLWSSEEFGTRENKLKHIVEHLAAIEEGMKEWSSAFAWAWGFATRHVAELGGTLLAWASVWTVAIIVLGYFGMKKLGITIAGSSIAKLLWPLQKLLPSGIPAWSPVASWTPWSTPEGPKTPRRFVEVNPADLKDFKPGEANHEEYYKKTVEKIKSLGTAPVAPAAWAPAPAPAITPTEASKRTTLFMRLDKEYRWGKMSLAEYLKRTEDILAWRGRVLVADRTGAVDKAESVKNVKQRIADRVPGVSQFTRNNPNGSAAASVSAMQEAKKRIKWASYESVDFAGTKVEFADATNRMLFEEFRDKLQKYIEMQEWDETNREIIAKEQLVQKIQNTDIPAKQNEIRAKNQVLTRTPQTIPWSPIIVAWQPPTIPQIQNPAWVAHDSELRELQKDVRDLNKQIQEINKDISTLRGKAHAYAPKGGTRAQFQADIRDLKLELSSPWLNTGLIQRINTAVWAGTIPESAFDRAALKIDKVRLLEVVKTALKK